MNGIMVVTNFIYAPSFQSEMRNHTVIISGKHSYKWVLYNDNRWLSTSLLVRWKFHLCV